MRDVSDEFAPTTTEEPGLSRGRAAFAGVLAAGAGLAVAELVAGLLSVRQTPVLAVGGAFIDLVPAWLKDLAIELFGTADKLVLIIGILVVLTGLAALVGILTARHRGRGLAVVGAVAVLAALIAVTRPDAGLGAVVPSLAAGVVAVVVLPWLLGRFDPERRYSSVNAVRRSRRDLLVTGGSLALGSLVAVWAGRQFGGRRLGVEDARTALDVPRPPTVRPPSGADLRLPDLSTWRTGNDVFYRIDTALTVPLVEPDDWRLRVHGMVDRELDLSLDDLLGRRIVHRWVTLACVSNEVGGSLVGNAVWTGVPLADVLKEAGVRPGADAVKSTSSDGFTCGTPLSVLTDDRESLLAFGMNGEPLPLAHGFPVRMVVPGLYGYVSATKWVVDIEVTRFADFRAYWTDRGWAEQAPIKTASRIDVPRSGSSVDAGRVAVAGVAWAQHRGIGKVEVRVDDRPWRTARLAGEPTVDSWRQWVWEWDATPGRHSLQVRATDGDGETQTSAVAPPAPDGSTGWHTIDVDVD